MNTRCQSSPTFESIPTPVCVQFLCTLARAFPTLRKYRIVVRLTNPCVPLFLGLNVSFHPSLNWMPPSDATIRWRCHRQLHECAPQHDSGILLRTRLCDYVMFTIMNYIRGKITSFFNPSAWKRKVVYKSDHMLHMRLPAFQNGLFSQLLLSKTDSFQPPQVANAGLAGFTSKTRPLGPAGGNTCDDITSPFVYWPKDLAHLSNLLPLKWRASWSSRLGSAEWAESLWAPLLAESSESERLLLREKGDRKVKAATQELFCNQRTAIRYMCLFQLFYSICRKDDAKKIIILVYFFAV